MRDLRLVVEKIGIVVIPRKSKDVLKNCEPCDVSFSPIRN